MNRRVLLAAWLLVSISATVHAKELFVDQHHPQAADANLGTEEQPFRTIQPAVNAAQPGDTVWVKEGDYEDQVRITSSGAQSAPVTLSAWKDDCVRIGYRPRPLPARGSRWRGRSATG